MGNATPPVEGCERSRMRVFGLSPRDRNLCAMRGMYVIGPYPPFEAENGQALGAVRRAECQGQVLSLRVGCPCAFCAEGGGRWSPFRKHDRMLPMAHGACFEMGDTLLGGLLFSGGQPSVEVHTLHHCEASGEWERVAKNASGVLPAPR